MNVVAEPEPIVPISALEHHRYCPRQCALVHVDGLWFDNEHTVRGAAGHLRADSGTHRRERGRQVLRAIPLWSESLGLSGRADVVEVTADGTLVPVEYKVGSRHGDAAHVQLCAQALCLEEMTGRPVREGFLWFAPARRRLRVDFDVDLRALTLSTIEEVRAWLRDEQLPPPVNDARCRQCQLLDHCQPELCADPDRIRAYLAEVVGCVC
ncbi:MAG TPA: CRISPR-associated protein Cas4 [Candidatus Dormibacteraeota bacterium]|nr:CRISPR-associated protein Cas4 [Candidatus Dormibacteraeota bacterium]